MEDIQEVLAPDVLASLLSHQCKDILLFSCRRTELLIAIVWRLRDDVGDDFNTLLEKFLSLSYSSRSKVIDPAFVCVRRTLIILPSFQADENVLMAKLTLHGVYGRLRADMFLSSLTESSSYLTLSLLLQNQLVS